MSNNPFFKTKDQNKSKDQNKTNGHNRFQCLDEDNLCENHPREDQTYKDNNIKKNKDVSAYNSINNSFKNRGSNPVRQEYNIRDEPRVYNNFKPQNRLQEPVKLIAEPLTLDLFPELIPMFNILQPTIGITNFLDVLNTQAQIEPEVVSNENVVKPGFVELTMIDRKLIMKHGPPTASEIKRIEIKKLNNDINYCMNKEFFLISNHWAKYKEDYNSIYGEGFYDEVYSLVPVYGPEYDIDDELDTDSCNEPYNEL